MRFLSFTATLTLLSTIVADPVSPGDEPVLTFYQGKSNSQNEIEAQLRRIRARMPRRYRTRYPAETYQDVYNLPRSPGRFSICKTYINEKESKDVLGSFLVVLNAVMANLMGIALTEVSSSLCRLFSGRGAWRAECSSGLASQVGCFKMDLDPAIFPGDTSYYSYEPVCEPTVLCPFSLTHVAIAPLEYLSHKGLREGRRSAIPPGCVSQLSEVVKAMVRW